jgi:hypothetical protein
MDFIHVSMLIAVMTLLAYAVARVVGMLRGTTEGLSDQMYTEDA